MIKKNREITQKLESPEPELAGCYGYFHITEQEGAPTFHLREFYIAPDRYPHHHVHDWEHEVYIISGQGEVFGKDEVVQVQAGDVLYIAPNEEHGFKAGSEGLRFICCIPAVPNPFDAKNLPKKDTT